MIKSRNKLKSVKINTPSFRAFNLKNREVIYCFNKCKPSVAFVCTNLSWGFYSVTNDNIDIDNCLASPVDSILSRGSGWYGVSGLEIYEHDIIKNLSNTEFSAGTEKIYLCGQVYYRNGVFYESYFNQPITNYKVLEVQGNFYEYPELLEDCPPVPKPGEEF
jgi:hypothetical protein